MWRRFTCAALGAFIVFSHPDVAQAGKADLLTVHWYEADHAFANPTGARYDAEDAALAWTRTTDFLAANLKG